jgi:HAD superfamily hydrolase (TIGR01509 family)
MLKAIFWDNDGVLVDTEHLYYDATRATLAEIGVAVSEAQFIELSLRQGRSVFDLARAQLDEARIETLRQARNTRYAERLRAGVAPLPGVETALAALHGRAQLAVVTSSNHDHFEIIHAATGLLRWFDFAITNRDYARSKPHPDPYHTALARAGCTADEAIAIEDSERGLAAARAAGLRCIVVPRGLTRGGSFGDAYRIVPDAGAVLEIVTPLLSR